MPELEQMQSGGVVYDIRDAGAPRKRELTDLQTILMQLVEQVSESTTSLANGFVVENEVLYLAHNGEILDPTNGVSFSEHTAGLQFDSGHVDEDGYLHLTYEGADIDDFTPFFVGSGGGGSSSGGGTASIIRVTQSGILATQGESCPIVFTFSASDSGGEPTGEGSEASWYVNNIKKATQILSLGENTFDIGPYLSVGNNTIKIQTLVDVGADNPIKASKTWVINAVTLSLTWDWDDTFAVDTDTVTVRWTPFGDISKTTHLLIDGTEVFSGSTSRSGVLQDTIIQSPSHGHHFAEMYLTATVSGTPIRSASIFHDMIFIAAGNTTPVVASSFADGNSIDQYDTISIPYVVYSPSSLASTVILKVDGVVRDTVTDVDRTVHYWHYTPSTAGDKVLTITCGNTSREIHLGVNAVEIDVEEVSGYAFRLKASDLAGNSALQSWTSNGVSASFSSNFDWTNGGIKTELDAAGNLRQYICIKAGTWMDINYLLFGSDHSRDGKSFHIAFKVTNVRNYDAQWLTCYANGIGLRMGAHVARLTSEQSSQDVQYAEDLYVEMDFDVYPSSGARYILPFINGVIAGVTIYGSGDNFMQTDKQTIRIGSADCDVYIYLVKAYPNVLTLQNHIANFIADAPNASEMMARYNRNDVTDQSGAIDYSKLAENNPDLRVHLMSIPRMTTGKKDYVYGVTYQQLYANGRPEDRIVAENCRLSVQGTSSVGYILGAANTDIKLQDGVTDENGVHTDGYAMTKDSIPVNYLCTKVNFASCEGVNNAVNAYWYNRFQPFISGVRSKNAKARDCMEFHMGVQFIADQSASLFGDTAYHMYSVCNMGNSKKNVDIFHDTSNPLECCVEVRANNRALGDMISKDFTTETWGDKEGDSFEFRYPDDPTTQMKSAWMDFVTWMCDNNPEAHTDTQFPEPIVFEPYVFRGHAGDGNVLKGTTVYDFAGTYTHDTFRYRIAKMLSECEDHLIMDAVMYHYLFIERHTAIDNVSKNNFWSTEDLVHWHPTKAYDMDTSDGNNNEGRMVFEYGLETKDSQNGSRVFNSPSAVWLVFAQELYEPARVMYIDREAHGAWSASEYLAECQRWQSCVPEVCWNQDYWYKYLRTYEQGIEESWMEMLDGGKKEAQRYQYELFQEKYMASKYLGAAATSDHITIRANSDAPSKVIALKMYSNCYISITVGSSATYRRRAQRGETYTIDFSDYGKTGDTELDINVASLIQSIGDISHLYPSYVAIGAATRLRSVQIGSAEPGYSNPGLTFLSFGNNTMLEQLYIQNLPSVEQPLDLSGCQALVEIDASGSGFTGFVFAKGGLLSSMILESPAALTLLSLHNLTSENVSIASYDLLKTLRIEDCPGLNTLSMVQAATNLTRARLLNIDWILPATDLLNRMLGIMGLDGSDEGRTLDTAVLTGDVTISGAIRQNEITAYGEAWDDLSIHYQQSQIVDQYLVIYQNADGTVLYTTYIDRGSAAPDPVATGAIERPVLAADQQYTYAYSGWDDLSTVVAQRTITAVYTRSTRMYTVTWYARAGLPLYSVTVEYGAEAIYPYGIPTNNEEESSFIYNVFMGWDKSTGFVVCDTDVFAVWDRAALPESDHTKAGFVPLSEMSPAQILGVRQTNAADAYWSPKDHFDVIAGRDYDFSNVESQVLIADPTYFDGNTAIDTNLVLFAEDSPNWTLAVDFEFTDTETDQTLVSAFAEDGSEGVRLRYSAAPNIQWGNVNLNVGNGMYRGMVVIRHKKGSRSIFVYAHNTGNGVYNNEMVAAEIARNRATVTDATLTFGAVKYSDGHDFYATGWIHWAKIWWDDLGAENARQMGNWPREKWRMEYFAAGAYRLSGTTAQRTAASFIMNNLLPCGHRHMATPTNGNTNEGGWPESEIRTFLDSRVLSAFPVWLQSLIRSVKASSSAGLQSSEIVSADCKVILPSYAEIATVATDPYISETTTRIPWMTTNPTRAKWRGIINPLSATEYFTGQTEPTMLETAEVHEGDIWVNSEKSSYVYMYFTAETAARHAFIGGSNLRATDVIEANRGGVWVIASGWWTRSPFVSSDTLWMYVSYNGGTSNGSSTSAIALAPSISI